MPIRFTILEHDHPFLHWDFLLDRGEFLQTWRLLSPPDSPNPITAELLPPHRVLYLDYQGPVSGNRGSVRQWDTGWLEIREDEPGRIRLTLRESRLQGDYRLRRRETGDDWLFQKEAGDGTLPTES